ncbi:hypothetical protein [Clostridium sp.]|uniref:hypothetical protein n=1 Tax=Clostridium sp. TaxID=1506 RepID=UPI002851B930|nr:hypothetical protein [Clostridium sp.]MDR3594657.1 hypothetical protein [Clostridium sp.]
MSMSKFFTALFLTIVLIMPANTAYAIQNSNQTKNQQYSTWLWDTSQIVKSPDEILNFLSTNNVKILYLQIDYNLNPDAYRSFIKKASMKNISVHALDGSSDWVSDSGTNKQKIFFDWLTKFQNTSSANEKFNGVHLDVEPYLNPDYNINMNKTLESYQAFLLNSLSNSNYLGLSLSIDIPFWFDGVNYNTKYGTGSLADWIMKNTKNAVIMVYRDNAAGDNGIINLASKELALGKLYNADVSIAVETQKSDEGNYVSFYEEGVNCMNRELDKVYTSYKNNSSFGGFAIHNVMSWMKLKK